MAQITVENLAKTYRVAERNPGLWGELIGYIGPNGAGKSTTVKVLSGLLVPDSALATNLSTRPGDRQS